MFFGKCTLPVSERNSLTLPSNFREIGGKAVYLTRGFDRNLILMSPQAFNTVYSQMKDISISDPIARLLNRLFLGSATEVAINNLGEIELPLNLSEYAELGNEIIIVGQGEYLEIWSPSLWQDQMNSINDCQANNHRFEKFHVSLI